jgi:hypothetical protein
MLVKGSRRSKNGDGKGFRDVWPRCRPEPCCKFSLMGQQSDGPLDPLVVGWPRLLLWATNVHTSRRSIECSIHLRPHGVVDARTEDFG